MPGPLTYAAIALFARDRLGQIQRALAAKQAVGNASELERHVLFLATEAQRMMSASQPVIEPPVRMYGPPLTDHVSRFMLLGAVGPDLPRYADVFAPGQLWLYDTLHKGTPDEHRERVLVHSTDLVFDFWKRVGPLLDGEFSEQSKRDAARDSMRAYVLGHLCHVAADVLSHPYFEALEARLADSTATPPVRYMRRDDVAGAFDVLISKSFFNRGTDTHTTAWANWFPATSDVPASFARALAESIRSLYGDRPQGLPAFEEEFGKIDPAPSALSADLISDSLESFRHIVEFQRVWTLGHWLGATAPMMLPMIFAYPAALALPRGKNLQGQLPPDQEAQRTYEMVAFPLAMTALGPLTSMIIVSASGRGLRLEGITGWIEAAVSLAASIGFFASLGGAGATRWVLLFAIPLGLALGQFLLAAIRGGSANVRKLLWLGPLWQVGFWALFLLLYKTWLHEGVEELDKPSAQRDDGKAWGYWAAWGGIVLVLWFVHAILWRWVFSSSVPDDSDALQNGEPRQFLRLYDDVGLVHDLAAPVDSERLSDLAYPPGRRPLLKLWWQAGTKARLQLTIDPDRHDRLTFHWPDPPAVPDHVVFAPIGAMTVERFGQLLAGAVTGDAAKGTLHVQPARDDEKGLELSIGALFSDSGDDRTDLAARNAAIAAPVDIPAAEAGALTLFHAPHGRLAQRMGRSGVVPDPKRAQQASKAGSLLQPAPAPAGPRQYQATNAGDGTSPLLRRLLRPGDVLEIQSVAPPAAGEQRIVEQVVSDTDVIVSSPFVFAIPPAGIGYKRAQSDRGVRLAQAAQAQLPSQTHGVGPNTLQAVVPPAPAPPPVAPPLGARLRVGDVLELVDPAAAAGAPALARRTVTAIRDGDRINVTIVAAGTVGTATFTFQVGSGPVSPATVSAASFPVPGSALTLYFTPGNFVAGDTWAIAENATVAPGGANTSTGAVATIPAVAVRITNAGAVGTARYMTLLACPQPIVVTVAAAGAVGVATFTFQVGAGPVSAAAPTAPEVPLAGTLIRARFITGNYVAGDSWTINPSGQSVPAGGNTSAGAVFPVGAVGETTAASVPVAGTITSLFFTPGNFVLGDSWTIAPGGAVVAAGGNTSTGGISAAIEPRLLELDAPAPAFTSWVALDRLSDAQADGFPYLADASDVFGDAGSVMNDAADLATLLCLGAASRLAPNDTPATPPGGAKPVHRVYQVFRNWDLDRRRLNEWKTIVSGGAESERRGDFRAAEEAAPIGPPDAGEVFSDAFIAQRQSAEGTVRELGWLGVFRSWVDMAARARTDAVSTEVFRAGAASNHDLSRAMAYLLDAGEGVAP